MNVGNTAKRHENHTKSQPNVTLQIAALFHTFITQQNSPQALLFGVEPRDLTSGSEFADCVAFERRRKNGLRTTA